jgi:hypothetical protein
LAPQVVLRAAKHYIDPREHGGLAIIDQPAYLRPAWAAATCAGQCCEGEVAVQPLIAALQAGRIDTANRILALGASVRCIGCESHVGCCVAPRDGLYAIIVDVPPFANPCCVLRRAWMRGSTAFGPVVSRRMQSCFVDRVGRTALHWLAVADPIGVGKPRRPPAHDVARPPPPPSHSLMINRSVPRFSPACCIPSLRLVLSLSHYRTPSQMIKVSPADPNDDMSVTAVLSPPSTAYSAQSSHVSRRSAAFGQAVGSSALCTWSRNLARGRNLPLGQSVTLRCLQCSTCWRRCSVLCRKGPTMQVSLGTAFGLKHNMLPARHRHRH